MVNYKIQYSVQSEPILGTQFYGDTQRISSGSIDFICEFDKTANLPFLICLSFVYDCQKYSLKIDGRALDNRDIVTNYTFGQCFAIGGNEFEIVVVYDETIDGVLEKKFSILLTHLPDNDGEEEEILRFSDLSVSVINKTAFNCIFTPKRMTAIKCCENAYLAAQSTLLAEMERFIDDLIFVMGGKLTPENVPNLKGLKIHVFDRIGEITLIDKVSNLVAIHYYCEDSNDTYVVTYQQLKTEDIRNIGNTLMYKGGTLDSNTGLFLPHG